MADPKGTVEKWCFLHEEDRDEFFEEHRRYLHHMGLVPRYGLRKSLTQRIVDRHYHWVVYLIDSESHLADKEAGTRRVAA
ncbi:hypothetical protein AB0B15_03075 [Streptomyces sp. NPDC045456]|uniref:hypothetical protein n=1 Tax=Streptomyces sp. NPDC045456 TaxID=3155254 RepID=UPI0033DC922A